VDYQQLTYLTNLTKKALILFHPTFFFGWQI
jgi:hypothetical protein